MRTSLWSSLLERLADSDANGAPKLCLGIDPHEALLEKWGLLGEPDALYQFSERVIDAFDENLVVALKPQSAFFEQHGSKGIKALEELLELAFKRSAPTILDVKRGDIGSTMLGYAKAYLENGSQLAADAITVSPYLGVETLTETAKIAQDNGRGLFVLCLTSNPEGYGLQHAQIADTQIGSARGALNGNGVTNTTSQDTPNKSRTTVAKQVFDWAYNYNLQNDTTIGLVIGATIGDGAIKAGLDLEEFNGPILSPGVGAQGAGAKELQALFGKNQGQVIPNVSRAVLNAGPEAPAMQEKLAKIVDSLKQTQTKEVQD